jgi:hypothetical protein
VFGALAARSDADHFDVRPVPESAPASAGPFRIEARLVRHGDVPAYAFRVSADGRTLGHSGDTVFDTALADWLGSADRVVYEAGAVQPGGDWHAHFSELVGLSADLRGKLLVAHLPDGTDLGNAPLTRLVQGRAYDV